MFVFLKSAYLRGFRGDVGRRLCERYTQGIFKKKKRGGGRRCWAMSVLVANCQNTSADRFSERTLSVPLVRGSFLSLLAPMSL